MNGGALIKEYKLKNINLNLRVKEIIDNKTDFKPMRIFFSYGHTEREICNLLCECLSQRGHTVWFDENEIMPGNDWRASIINGVLNCENFIAGLSKHYVRENSVCLDELSVAIGVKRGNIKTILFDKEDDVSPPSSVSGIQWLDMHDWFNKMNDDAEFIPWFCDRLAELISTIEAVPDREFNGQISKIKEKLNPLYSVSKQVALLQKNYTERIWLNNLIDDWLKDADSERICMIYGEPGSGKSIFATNYSHYNPYVAASIFCESNKPYFNDTKNIIKLLAFQLATRLPDYRVLLEYLIRDTSIEYLNEAELFDVLIANPLCNNIDGKHDTFCIVIDGLDECGDYKDNALALVLKKYVNRLPQWLKVLVFSRPESSVTNLLNTSNIIYLAKQKESLEDIKNYIKAEMSHIPASNEKKTFVNTLVNKSEGVFLYVEIVLNELKHNYLKLSESWELPNGLGNAIYQWFLRMFPDSDEFDAKYADAISMILATENSLPKEELKIVLKWKRCKVEDFLRKLQIYLQVNPGRFDQEEISFNHRFVYDWITSNKAGRFQCFGNDGIEIMADAYLSIYKNNGAEALTMYESLHLTELLKQTNNVPESLNKDKGLFDKIMTYGFNSQRHNDALYCYRKAYLLVENNTADLMNVSAALSMMGVEEEFLGYVSDAIVHLRMALDISEKILNDNDDNDNKLSCAMCLTNLANLEYHVGDNNSAEMHFFTAFTFLDGISIEDKDDFFKRQMGNIYERIGIYYRDLWNYKLADKCFEKVATLIENLEEEDEFWKIQAEINKYVVKEDCGMDEISEDFLIGYLKLTEQKTDIFKVDALIRLGRFFEKNGNVKAALQQYQNAREVILPMIEKEESVPNKRQLFSVLASIASLETKDGTYSKTIDEALAFGEQLLSITSDRVMIETMLMLFVRFLWFEDIGQEKANDVMERALRICEKANQCGYDKIADRYEVVFYSRWVEYRVNNLHEDESMPVDLFERLIHLIEINEETWDIICDSVQNIVEYLMYNEKMEYVLKICEVVIRHYEKKEITEVDDYDADRYSYFIKIQADCLTSKGYEEEARKHYLKAIDVQELATEKDIYAIRRIYFSYNLIGIIYMNNGEYRLAENAFEKAKFMIEAHKNIWESDEFDNYSIIDNNLLNSRNMQNKAE